MCLKNIRYLCTPPTLHAPLWYHGVRSSSFSDSLENNNWDENIDLMGLSRLIKTTLTSILFGAQYVHKAVQEFGSANLLQHHGWLRHFLLLGCCKTWVWHACILSPICTLQTSAILPAVAGGQLQTSRVSMADRPDPPPDPAHSDLI